MSPPPHKDKELSFPLKQFVTKEMLYRATLTQNLLKVVARFSNGEVSPNWVRGFCSCCAFEKPDRTTIGLGVSKRVVAKGLPNGRPPIPRHYAVTEEFIREESVEKRLPEADLWPAWLTVCSTSG